MADIKEILAQNLKDKRRKRGLTQEKLAEKANMSLQYLALLELARKFPSGDMLERIAAALDIETYELLAVAPSANNELETLRIEIIHEVKTLNEELFKKITKRLINPDLAKGLTNPKKCPFAEERKKKKKYKIL